MCPITSKIKGYPFEVKIKSDKIDGAILADHIRNLDWSQRKAKFITKISENEMIKTLSLIGVILKI
jgi:mRNA interferase MazF